MFNKNVINFNSFDEISLNYKELESGKVGGNSKIFVYSPTYLIKILKKSPSTKHMDILNYFKNNYNGIMFIKPDKFVTINNILYGYILNNSNGTMLNCLDKSVCLNGLFDSFKGIDDEIRILSNKGILMNDINSKNILYDRNTNVINIIDYDNYEFTNISKDILYKRNLSDTLQSIIFSFIKQYKKSSVGEYSREVVLRDNITIKEILYEIKSYIEYITKCQINTVGDLEDNKELLLKIKYPLLYNNRRGN